MRSQSYSDEAEACRRQAVQFAGRPEARFLLRLAGSFEELQGDSRFGASRRESHPGELVLEWRGVAGQ